MPGIVQIAPILGYPTVLRLAASGGLGSVSLLELKTVSNNKYFWSDANITTDAVLDTYYTPASGINPPGVVQGGYPETFLPWIVNPPTVRTYRSTQTSTASLDIQNVTGDLIRRDAAQIFNKVEMMGALVYLRTWQTETETALSAFQGKVTGVSVDADGDSMNLSLEGFTNWAKIKAPDQQIGVSCGLAFGSIECGSTSPTPCFNNYGTCSSTNRFKGIVLEWTGATLNYSQYVQPEPLRVYNARSQG